MRVIVVGDGRLGAGLAAALAAGGNEVVHVVADRATPASEGPGGTQTMPVGEVSGGPHTMSAGEVSGEAHTMSADPLDPATLEAAGALRADVVVACTPADHDNLAVAALAKRRFDVPRVVALLNDPDSSWLFDAGWGVDAMVSASATLLALVEEATGAASAIDLDLATAGVSVLELTVAPSSPASGRSLAELGLPTGVVIGAVVRAGRTVVPAGSFRLAPGDRILMMAEPGRSAGVHALFAPDADQ